MSTQFNSKKHFYFKLVYSTAPADWTLVGGVLPLYRGAVGAFYTPSMTDSSLLESNPLIEMYSTPPAEWAVAVGWNILLKYIVKKGRNKCFKLMFSEI